VKEDEIINRVASSSLITLDLEEFYPAGLIEELDVKNLLFQELILREKDLRNYIKVTDWQQYKGKHVAVFCSADAVIPTWTYMLLGIALQPFAASVVFGNREALISQLFMTALNKVDWGKFKDAKVVIKGCSDIHVPESAYVEAAIRLRPLVSGILYGEPCSTVPLFKKSK
jgi:hypothetical protein